MIVHLHTEESDFLHASTSRVVRDAANIQNAKSGAVVRLVSKSVRDILVVVDTLCSALVQSSLFGRTEG